MKTKIKLINNPLFKAVQDALNIMTNDLSQQLNFVTNTTNLVACDSIATNKSNLQSSFGKVKGNLSKASAFFINKPYKSDLTYKQDTIFDNHKVTEKLWTALYTVRDWAEALDTIKDRPKTPYNLTQLFIKAVKTTEQNRAMKFWHPKSKFNSCNILLSDDVAILPENTPERAVAVFLEHWSHKRFALIGDNILYATDISKGERAYRAKLDFDKIALQSFKIVSTDKQNIDVTKVLVALNFQVQEQIISKEVFVRVAYQQSAQDTMIESAQAIDLENSQWKIMQNSLSTVLFSTDLQQQSL